jgi:alkanesulfonate monooxygenase SsuD/methylene tetrahydromethanopterin reductase-like flavin-dependent oxidoreductase (luciferase family)
MTDLNDIAPGSAMTVEPTSYREPPSAPVGIAFTPFESRVDVIVRLAQRADAAGLDRVDLAEGWTHDSMVLLAELALKTSRIGLGTSVVSAWGRTPATIAMGAAGLQRCSRGRFRLGIGASSPPLTEGFHGLAWQQPLTRVRNTLTAVRSLLRGERLPDPAQGARPLRLAALPDPPVPITLAALSAGSIRLAGELADAWGPFLWARSRLQDGLELLAEGRARSELQAPPITSVGVPVALGRDEATARRLACWWLSTYTTRMGPLYPRMLAERFGMAAGVRAVIDAAREDRDAELPAAAEDLAREVTLMGRHDEAAAMIDAWFVAGAESVQLVLPPGHREEELAEVIDTVAGIVARPSPALVE